MVILAPGISAPVGSAMCPRKVPVTAEPVWRLTPQPARLAQESASATLAQALVPAPSALRQN